MAKKKGNGAALEKFNKRVASIKRAHPGMSHAAAQQKAKKDKSAGKRISGTKKKSSPKKRKTVGAVKRRTTRMASSTPRKVGTVAHTRSKLKNMLKEQLAWALLARDSAARVRDKKKKGKKVTEIKRELRAINGIAKKRSR